MKARPSSLACSGSALGQKVSCDTENQSRVFFSSCPFYLFFIYVYFNWRLITLQYCIGFAIHHHESATGVHVFPILNPPPTALPIPSSLGHPSAPAPCILYPASNLEWRFVSHMIYISMPFSQIILPSPPPTESKRLFYTSVSLLLSHIQGYRYHLKASFGWFNLFRINGNLSDSPHPHTLLQDGFLGMPRELMAAVQRCFTSIHCYYHLSSLVFGAGWHIWPVGMVNRFPLTIWYVKASISADCQLEIKDFPLKSCFSWHDSLSRVPLST